MNKKYIIYIAVGALISVLLAFILVRVVFVPKIITSDGAVDVRTSYGDEYSIPEGKVFILNKELNNEKVTIDGEVDINKIGVYTITYSYKNGIFSAKLLKHVTVEDVIPPVIELEGDAHAYVCPNTEYKEIGYKGYDDYDGDLTDKVESVIEGNLITYKLYDSSSNNYEVHREIEYKDVQGPKITLTGGDGTIYTGSSYTEAGYKANDNCDGDVTNKVVVSGNVDGSTVGTYYKSYQVTDNAGNTTIVKRKITVQNRPSAGSYISGGSPGVIYLTFDDGPSADITPRILDTLKKYNVKATFFVIGRGPDEMIKREYNEGHAIGLHSYTHDWKSVYSSADGFWAEMNRVSDRVYNLTGYRSNIIRFPGGSSNTVSRRYKSGIMSYLAGDVIAKGYQYFDWNVDSNDAGGTTDPNEEYNNIIRGLSKSRGNIILMHDVKKSTSECLERVIQYGLENGYTFEVLTKDTTPSHHGVNN